MTPDDLAPTPELLAAVKAERDRLQAVIDDLKNRRTDLVDELQLVDDRLRTATSRNRQLGHVLGDGDPQSPLWEPEVAEVLAGRTVLHENDGMLRGAAIRDAAVRAALADPDPGRPRHYRDWLGLVQAHAGRKVDGRDPGATLLTQLSRCPLIVRCPDAGTYQLDAAALQRLRQRRDSLRAQAAEKVSAAAHHDDGDPMDLAQKLARIENEIRRTDRAIEEADQLVAAIGASEFFTRSLEHGTGVAAAA